jgi:hypothetical protein
MIPRFCGLAILLLAAPGLAAAQGLGQDDYPGAEHYILRLEYREFRPALTGTVQKGLGGTAIDLIKDLKIEDKRTFEVDGALQIKRGHKLRGSYTPLDYRGDVAELRKTFVYGGTTFERFSRVVTSLKGGYYSASYEWDFLRGPRGYLGALIGAKMFDIDTIVVAPVEGQREVQTTRDPLPALGVTGRVYAWRFSFEGEFSGLTLGDRGSIYEFQMGTRFHLSDRIAAQGGYRTVKREVKDGADQGVVKIGGWQFGLELSL